MSGGVVVDRVRMCCLLMVAMLALWGCCDKEKLPQDPPIDTSVDYFQFAIDTVTYNYARIRVSNPRELPVVWCCGVADATALADTLSLADVDSLINVEWLEMLSALGVGETEWTKQDNVESKLVSPGGEYTNRITLPWPDHDYVLWAVPIGWRRNAIGRAEQYRFSAPNIAFDRVFAVDRGDFYERATKVYYVEFAVAEQGAGGEVFCFELEAPEDSVSLVGDYSFDDASSHKLVAGEKAKGPQGNYLKGSHFGYVRSDGYFDMFYLIDRGRVVVEECAAGYRFAIECESSNGRQLRFTYEGGVEFMNGESVEGVGADGGQRRLVRRVKNG